MLQIKLQKEEKLLLVDDPRRNEQLYIISSKVILVNIYLLDFNNPFEGDSMVALIGIAASFCAVLILLIFRMSKKIEDKLKN